MQQCSHLGFCDTLYSSGPIPVCLYSHNDGFRASRGHRSGSVGIVVQPETHRDYLCLHFPNGRENVRMERVGDAVALVGSDYDFLKVIPTVYVVYSKESSLQEMRQSC